MMMVMTAAGDEDCVGTILKPYELACHVESREQTLACRPGAADVDARSRAAGSHLGFLGAQPRLGRWVAP